MERPSCVKVNFTLGKVAEIPENPLAGGMRKTQELSLCLRVLMHATCFRSRRSTVAVNEFVPLLDLASFRLFFPQDERF